MTQDICWEEKGIDPEKIAKMADLAQARYIGWMLSGVAAAIATGISIFLIYKHAQYYTKPNQQRYIIRIILMVPIYATVSWLSYFFYQQDVYYETLRDCYEAFVIASFFILLLQYIGDSSAEQKHILQGRDWPRMRLTLPFCCITYNPGSAHFLQLLKYGILQYVVIRPVMTVTAVILQYYGVYCPESMSLKHSHIYITGILFVSVSVALYALITFYVTMHEELKPHKPFSKFLCVKLVIFFSFWQDVVIVAAADFGYIRETQYWTIANISSGLNAILICFEMIFFAILHARAFDYRVYRPASRKRRAPWRAIVDAFNPWDFISEIAYGVRYLKYLFGGKAPEDDRTGHATLDLEGVLGKARPGSVDFGRRNTGAWVQSEVMGAFQVEEHHGAESPDGTSTSKHPISKAKSFDEEGGSDETSDTV